MLYNGWTYQVSPGRRCSDELRTVLSLCFRHPLNAYWRARLIGLLRSWQWAIGRAIGGSR